MISKLFSSSVVREIITRGHSSLISLIKQSELIEQFDSNKSLEEFFNYTYDYLCQPDYRPEYVYKNQLFINTYSSEENATFLTEFRSGEARADVIVFNETSIIYEIKTDRDSLMRLKTQLKYYQKISGEIYIISGQRHLEKLHEILPEHIGIITLNNDLKLIYEKKAIVNLDHLDKMMIFDSLRTVEIKDILTALKYSVPEVPNTKMRTVLKEMCIKLSREEMYYGMVDAIKKNRSISSLGDFISSLPYSLKVLGLTTRLTLGQRSRLIDLMKMPLSNFLS